MSDTEAAPAASAEIDLWGAIALRGRVARWDGAELLVLAPGAAPPGARFEARLAPDGVHFRMKSVRCRKLDPDTYEIALRVLDLSRAARSALDALRG